MTKRINLKFGLVILLVVALWLAILSLGDIKLAVPRTVSAVFGDQSDYVARIVVWQMRMPNVWAALITGSGLSISGLILQTLTKNPLADSSILGINAGASLGAVSLIGIASITTGITVNQYLPLAVLIGACLSLSIIGLLNRRGGQNQILLGGIALTAVLNGLILLIELQVNQFDFDKILVWLSGSYWNPSWSFLNGYAIIVAMLVVGTWCLHRELDVLGLGRQLATSLGQNVNLMRLLLTIFAIGLAASAVSVGGAISFVGLMAPNIARQLVGSTMKRLIPMSLLVGWIIMLSATLVANTVFLPSTLPVGLVVAAITMPYFIYQLFKN